jgi:hypothetical protein
MSLFVPVNPGSEEGASQPLLPKVVSACIEIDWAWVGTGQAKIAATQHGAIRPRILWTTDRRMPMDRMSVFSSEERDEARQQDSTHALYAFIPIRKDRRNAK